MKRVASISLVAVGAVAGFWAAGLVARPAVAEPEKKAPAAAAAPDEAAMMEAWLKVSTPGAEHKLLDQFAGTWTAKSTWFMPGAPPDVNAGEMKCTWVLGGRWLRQEWTGTMMGQPHVGIGYWGYDVQGKAFAGLWMDSMGTAWMTTSGSHDAAAHTWTMTGTFKDPIGNTWKQRQVIGVKNADENWIELHHTGPDGKEALAGKIEYTRKK